MSRSRPIVPVADLVLASTTTRPSENSEAVALGPDLLRPYFGSVDPAWHDVEHCKEPVTQLEKVDSTWDVAVIPDIDKDKRSRRSSQVER